MNDFLNSLLKIRSEFFRRMRFLFILDLISIFSIFYAVFIILNAEFFLERYSLDTLLVKIIPPATAFIIAITFVLLLHRKDSRINVIPLIEGRYPELRERLRTAYDNRDEINIIVESLKSNVTDALSSVSPSQLLAKGKIISKLLMAIIFILSVAVFTLNPEYRIPPEIVTNISKTITETAGNITNVTIGEVVGVPPNNQKAGKSSSGEIFGNPKIAPVEGKPVDLQLELGLGIGNVPRDYSQTQNQFIQSAVFPVDVLGTNVSDGGYSILIEKTETEKKLIEDYAVERSKL